MLVPDTFEGKARSFVRIPVETSPAIYHDPYSSLGKQGGVGFAEEAVAGGYDRGVGTL
jgi:hypothetical protein